MTTREILQPEESAVTRLRQADSELMRAQAMLVVCGAAVLNAESMPDAYTLASVIESAKEVIAGAATEVEEVRVGLERGAQ